MTPRRNPDTRQRLLDAAAELIAAAPGQDVPLRAICDRVGVKLPTLYHFFASKEGLLDAVVEHGFDLYLGQKSAHESSGDPVQDIRDGWDTHVAFGLANPGFYALMYGQVAPGSRPAAQERATAILRGLTASAAAQGRLVVDADQAADHVLAANVGVTLHQITAGRPDAALSVAVRDATIAALTGAEHEAGTGAAERTDLARRATQLLDALGGAPSPLGAPETALLRSWLTTLARARR